ncbi:MAG: bile acid:sodium symporter [bacterium]
MTNPLIIRIKHQTKNWFYYALVAAFIFGWYLPGAGGALKHGGLLPWLVAGAFFLNGFILATDDVLRSIREWRALGFTLVSSFVAAPMLVFVVHMLLPGGDTPLAQGFQLLAVVPTMLVSTVVLTRIARGNAALALFLTVSTNLLAIVIVPLLLHLTLNTGAVSLDIPAITSNLLLTVLLPTVAGQLARHRWHAWAVRYQRVISVLSQCIILLFIIIAMVDIPRGNITPATWLFAIGGALLLHITLLVGSASAGKAFRFDTPSRHALTFCGAQKSMAFFVILYDRIYATHPGFGMVVLPAIIFYVIELGLDSVLAQRWGGRGF